MSKRAFTLVELLITATIMVAVSFLTLSIFSTVAKVQADRRTTQTVLNQIDTVVDQIAVELESINRTVDGQNERIKTFPQTFTQTGSQYASFIAVNVPLLDDRGVQTGNNVLRIYCRSLYVSPAQAGEYYRLSVFSTPPLNSSDTTVPLTAEPTSCTMPALQSALQSAMGNTLSLTETVLTDEFTNIRFFGAYPMQSKVENAGSAATGPNMTLRLTLTASYDERMKYSDVPPLDPQQSVTTLRTISRAKP